MTNSKCFLQLKSTFMQAFVKMLLLQIAIILPAIILLWRAQDIGDSLLLINFIYLIVILIFRRQELASLGISTAALAAIPFAFIAQYAYLLIRRLISPDFSNQLPYEWTKFADILSGYLLFLATYTFILALLIKAWYQKEAWLQTFSRFFILQVGLFAAMLLIRRLYGFVQSSPVDYEELGFKLLIAALIISLIYLIWQVKVNFSGTINLGLPLAFAVMPVVLLVNIYKLIANIASRLLYRQFAIRLPDNEALYYEQTILYEQMLSYYCRPLIILTLLICLAYHIVKSKRKTNQEKQAPI